jgi:hypothetical protein
LDSPLGGMSFTPHDHDSTDISQFVLALQDAHSTELIGYVSITCDILPTLTAVLDFVNHPKKCLSVLCRTFPRQHKALGVVSRRFGFGLLNSKTKEYAERRILGFVDRFD